MINTPLPKCIKENTYLLYKAQLYRISMCKSINKWMEDIKNIELKIMKIK
jgi:hypothetical protein